MTSLESLFSNKIDALEKSFAEYLSSPYSHPGVDKLVESVNYSLLSGGKRFRPVLSLLAAEALGLEENKVLPFALSVEFVHTYSLIHDDLPCMDDDDERRGQPTNHKKYGEAVALLAGDSLLTEAFLNIARSYKDSPEVAVQLTEALGRSSGLEGMISGQMMDIFENPDFNQEQMTQLHRLKTGALIAVSVEGAVICSEATGNKKQALIDYGQNLGFAFQLADDIDDFDEAHPEPANMVNILGLDKTYKLLGEVTAKALSGMDLLGEKGEKLKQIALFNQQRVASLHAH